MTARVRPLSSDGVDRGSGRTSMGRRDRGARRGWLGANLPSSGSTFEGQRKSVMLYQHFDPCCCCHEAKLPDEGRCPLAVSPLHEAVLSLRSSYQACRLRLASTTAVT